MSSKSDRANKQKIHAQLFAALGDNTRLSIVDKLSNGQPQSITALTHGTQLTRQAITKHLRVLENAGLVKNIQSGRESLYKLTPKPIGEAKRYLDEVSRQWEDMLARLKRFVEDADHEKE